MRGRAGLVAGVRRLPQNRHASRLLPSGGDRYVELAGGRDVARLRARLQSDIESGSACAACAAFKLGLPRQWPLVAWAYPREFLPDAGQDLALLRALLWMRFDPDARDAKGYSALDLMLGAKRGWHCRPRAVEILLEAGADPDAVDRNGDAPLLSLARSEHWCEDRDACARLLVQSGADMLAMNQGETFEGALRSMQDKRPSALRGRLLAELAQAARTSDGVGRAINDRCDGFSQGDEDG